MVKVEDGVTLTNVLNPKSKQTLHALSDAPLRALARSDIVQIERKGFYVCDHNDDDGESPLVLVRVPDKFP